jgi:hypothetical protein
MSFDGYNAMADAAFGISTQGSRIRNANRGDALHHGIEVFSNMTGSERFGVASEIITTSILGAAVSSTTATGVILGGKEIKYWYDAVTLHKKVHGTNWNHLFAPKGTIPRPGHLEDTFLNRREIVKTFSQKENHLGTNQWGNDFYAKMRKDGTQTWVEMRGNRLENAGRNEIPIEFHPKTGLKASIKPSKNP